MSPAAHSPKKIDCFKYRPDLPVLMVECWSHNTLDDIFELQINQESKLDAGWLLVFLSVS